MSLGMARFVDLRVMLTVTRALYEDQTAWATTGEAKLFVSSSPTIN